MAIVVLDRIGDLNERLLARLASQGVDPDRIHIIDPTDPVYTTTWNPLGGSGAAHQRAGAFVAAVKDRSSGWGVQIDENCRCVCAALAETGHSPLEIDYIFTSDSFRAEVASGVTDLYVQQFFERLGSLSKEQRQTLHLALANKLSPFLGYPQLRRMLCGGNSLNLHKLIDEPGAILLVSLRGDQLHDAANLLGELLVRGLWQAALGRADVPEDKRSPVLLIADEFQNFGQSAFAEIVAEGRRFAVRLCLAHQSQSQVEPSLRSLIRNNAAIRVLFSPGPVDAEELAKELAPMPKPAAYGALMKLQTGQAFVVKRGKKAVKVVTPDAPKPNVALSVVEALRQAALVAHARPIAEVDADIEARLSRIAKSETTASTITQEVRHVRKPRVDA